MDDVLEKVQRRAARYVCHRYHNTSSVTEMMDDLSWSTLKERGTKTRLINFYKISNNKMDTDILKPNQSKTFTRTSHSKTFRQLPCKKDSFKYSFFCNTIPDWIKLPETIANSDSIKSFKEKLTHEVHLKTYPQFC